MTDNSENYIGRRVAATIIDYTLVYAFSFGYIYIIGDKDDEGTYVVTGPPALVPLVFWFFYFVVTETYLDGTLGHQLLKIKVFSADHTSLSLGQVLVRRVFDIFDIVCCFGLVAFILVNTNENAQRIGDLVAKTVVRSRNKSPQ